MKTILTLIGCIMITANTTHAQIALSKLNPDQYYDFWIGEWNLTWETKTGDLGHGENSIAKILKDRVIEENFNVLNDPNMPDYKGRSWTVYNTSNNTWNQTWVDNQGSYLDFIGEFIDNKRIFKREVPKSDGSSVLQRMVFYNIN